ncbi:MAG: response regulator transcription factor [Thermoanaerobaculia bacterium]
MRLLVVEDDEDFGPALVEVLEDERYAVDLARDGNGADELAAVNEYDLILLDWSIPEPSGIELLARWRRRGLQTPILMLTGHKAVDERVSGLDSGADDYLTKPFAFEELLARVRSLLRRRVKPRPPLTAGDLELDPAARRVRIEGKETRLTPKEFGLLEYLLHHPDETMPRQKIVEHVWDDSFDAMSNTLDVIVSRLRRKIDGGRQARLLHTVPGVGYMLSSQRRADEDAG